MALIESIIATLILFLISNTINKHIPEEKQIPRVIHRKNSALIVLIVFGIIFAIRSLLEILEYSFYLGSIINNDALMFAIMTTLFYFLYKEFVFKQKRFGSIGEELFSSPFIKIFRLFVVLSWIISVIFLSIPLLQIRMNNPDIFNLGFIWAALAVGFDMILTILINRIRQNEKRIPKEILKYSMFSGGLISFGIWSIQLVIFELYLNRLFGLMLFPQDIRILFGVVSGIYGCIFYVSLKKRFLPIAEEKSKLKVQRALEIFQEQTVQDFTLEGNHTILDVKDLTTYFHTEEGTVHAVEGVSFKVYEGEVLGLVGETGCGKSVTALSILRVIRPPGKIEKGSVIFRGENLLIKPESEMLKYRGKDITMIFQDPLNSLNPVFRIGKQISEVYLLHMENELLAEASKFPDKTTYGIAREWSIDLLRELNIPFPQVIIDRYPHELSGGMRQRVQIAMALACRPKLLIADEPTTALDVTIQNQILKQMKELRKKYNTTILFITHDLGIISKMCNRVAVMYCGSIVEYGDIKKLFTKPYHPYTRGLIASVPVMRERQQQLEIIPGMVPNLIYPPLGCRFHPRCHYCFEPCDSKAPIQIEVEPGYFVACHLYDPEYESLAKISIRKIEDISE
ncbi:MAG: ABC transporter ATP-binding protein [Promethearchaeota archaeon]|jgi:oligopeptide/dipeptide ABC transporter ATP-binding protein